MAQDVRGGWFEWATLGLSRPASFQRTGIVRTDGHARTAQDLAGAFDPNPTVTVAVFDHETEEFAARRHVQLRPEHRGMMVRFDHRREERGMLAEAFAVRAGATEEDAITLRQRQRPLHGSRSFLDFNEDDGDDCGESLAEWEAYHAEMAAGLLVPQSVEA